MIVLDASALLAFLLREPGHERVAALLADASMSTVNLSEVLGRFARAGKDVTVVAQRLLDTPVQWMPFTALQATLAATLVPHTLAAGLSLGDRACLALAAESDAVAVTADRAWRRIDVGVRVELIR